VSLKILKQTDAAVFGVDGRLFLGYFTGRVRTADVAGQEESIRRSALRDKSLAISWIGENLTLGERGRRRVQEMLTNVDDDLLAWAIVIPPTGFWSSIARTIASAARLASKANYPFRVFDRLPPACDWLRTHLDDPALDRAETSISTLRSMLPGP
jgi:hypothetical protein